MSSWARVSTFARRLAGSCSILCFNVAVIPRALQGIRAGSSQLRAERFQQPGVGQQFVLNRHWELLILRLERAMKDDLPLHR